MAPTFPPLHLPIPATNGACPARPESTVAIRVYREHLDQYGNGFHHTCLVYPTVSAVSEAKAMLVAQGRELVQEAATGDLFDFAYFAFPEIGSLVEVLFVDVENMPAPEAVI